MTKYELTKYEKALSFVAWYLMNHSGGMVDLRGRLSCTINANTMHYGCTMTVLELKVGL